MYSKTNSCHNNKNIYCELSIEKVISFKCPNTHNDYVDHPDQIMEISKFLHKISVIIVTVTNPHVYSQSICTCQ